MTDTLRGSLAGKAATQHGMFTRRQALEAGYSPKEVRRLLARGHWHRLRRGYYMEQTIWSAMSAIDQHRAMVRAVLDRIDDPAAASHWSAGRVLGLLLYKPETKLIHVTRTSVHRSRIEAGVQHHGGKLATGDVVLVDGIATTTPARTIMDIACSGTFESALVAADGAVRLDLTTVERLREEAKHHLAWAGAPVALEVARRVDGRSESPGETLCRIVLSKLGIPEPDLQVKYFNPNGSLFARTDFGWRALWTVAEFDGKVKYQRDLRDGEEPGDIVFREKKREDRLREFYGLEVVRITWSDLYPDAWPELRRRILDAFARAKALHRSTIPT